MFEQQTKPLFSDSQSLRGQGQRKLKAETVIQAMKMLEMRDYGTMTRIKKPGPAKWTHFPKNVICNKIK